MPSASAASTGVRWRSSDRTAAASCFLAAAARGATASAAKASADAPARMATTQPAMTRARMTAPCRALQADAARTLAELLRVDARGVHDRQHQVGERRALRHLDVAVAVVLAGGAADEQRRQVLVVVLVAVGHAAAVEEQRVIQQASVAVRRLPQLVEELGEEVEVVDVHLDLLGHLLG